MKTFYWIIKGFDKDKNQKRSHSYKKLNSKIITPGNFITTDINYIGAALTNSGVIFPFRKRKKKKIIYLVIVIQAQYNANRMTIILK